MKTNHLVVEMGPKGYGMILKSIRVYIGDSNNYRIHHIVQVGVACRLTLYLPLTCSLN